MVVLLLQEDETLNLLFSSVSLLLQMAPRPSPMMEIAAPLILDFRIQGASNYRLDLPLAGSPMAVSSVTTPAGSLPEPSSPLTVEYSG